MKINSAQLISGVGEPSDFQVFVFFSKNDKLVVNQGAKGFMAFIRISVQTGPLPVINGVITPVTRVIILHLSSMNRFITYVNICRAAKILSMAQFDVTIHDDRAT